MTQTGILNEINVGPKDHRKSALKTTFLDYLGHALREEKYEVCRDLIEVANDLGAKPWEVNHVIQRHAHNLRIAPGRVS